jgi:hypothetical protein
MVASQFNPETYIIYIQRSLQNIEMFTHLSNVKSTTTANADPSVWNFKDQYPDSDEESDSQDGAPMEDIVQALKPAHNPSRTW